MIKKILILIAVIFLIAVLISGHSNRELFKDHIVVAIYAFPLESYPIEPQKRLEYLDELRSEITSEFKDDPEIHAGLAQFYSYVPSEISTPFSGITEGLALYGLKFSFGKYSFKAQGYFRGYFDILLQNIQEWKELTADRTIGEYKRAISLDPNNVLFHLGLAYVYLGYKDYAIWGENTTLGDKYESEMIKELETALKLEPDNALYNYLLAHLHFQKAGKDDYIDGKDRFLVEDEKLFNLAMEHVNEGVKKGKAFFHFSELYALVLKAVKRTKKSDYMQKDTAWAAILNLNMFMELNALNRHLRGVAENKLVEGNQIEAITVYEKLYKLGLHLQQGYENILMGVIAIACQGSGLKGIMDICENKTDDFCKAKLAHYSKLHEELKQRREDSSKTSDYINELHTKTRKGLSIIGLLALLLAQIGIFSFLYFICWIVSRKQKDIVPENAISYFSAFDKALVYSLSVVMYFLILLGPLLSSFLKGYLFPSLVLKEVMAGRSGILENWTVFAAPLLLVSLIAILAYLIQLRIKRRHKITRHKVMWRVIGLICLFIVFVSLIVLFAFGSSIKTLNNISSFTLCLILYEGPICFLAVATIFFMRNKSLITVNKPLSRSN